MNPKSGNVKQLAISAIGIGYQHPPGFTIDRPNGFNGDVFVHFLVPVRIRTAEGLQKAAAHSCVIYTCDHPEWYTGDNVGLENHWFHASGPCFRRLLQNYGIPANRIIRPILTDFIPAILSELRSELSQPDAHTGRQIEILLERLCTCLARSLRDRNSPGITVRQRELREAFQKLRETVHKRPQATWSVEKMAEQVHLSVSRFSPLYRKFFGVSPHDDVLNTRMERAKWLLTSTTEKVSTVAEQSGFASIYHFSRLFRKKTGCAPTAYLRR